MEHFDEKQGMKKKSFYTFQLDTPRVIIAVSVFLGVVALTFLLGMTFTKGDKAKPDSLTVSDLLASDRHDSSGTFQALQSQNDPVEIIQPNNQLEPQVRSQTDADSALITSNKPMSNNDLFSHSDAGTAADGVFINDSPTPKREKAVEKKKENKETKKKSKIASKENTTPDNRNVKKDVTKKKSVVVPAVNESKSPAKGVFAVQVASYDKRSSAVNEIENLKRLNYNAYMNDTLVDGKQFFRVRIGPLSSKEKAASILNEIQDNDRYASSYIVKE